MNSLVEEMMSYYGIGSADEDSLKHFGKGHLDGGHSGRYPWGSGEDGYQRSVHLMDRIEKLKREGWTETPENIKAEFGITTTEYRTQKSLAKEEIRSRKVNRAKALKEDGLGPTEIARILSKELGESINESTVRSLLDAKSESRMRQAKDLADFLREQVDTKGMIDVGGAIENELSVARDLNVSREKLNQALTILKSEGYEVWGGGVPQITNKGQQTNLRVLCPPGTEHKEIYNFDNVHTITEYTSHDNGKTFDKFHYPKSIDSSRVLVLTADEISPTDGVKSSDKDGLIQLRRNVPDLSLGDSNYAQVRILVDDNKYLKGMAVYCDNMPEGIDIVFNSNKPTVEKAYKEIKKDPENPFGSAIKEKGGQYWYDPKTGNRKTGYETDNDIDWQLGAINKRSDEGDWTEWKDKLPAQFLSKQSLSLAKQQLNLAILDKQNEYEGYSELTNPTVKKYLLNKFADECDSAAVHLQASALPGQKYHVIIPVNTLKDNEIYAPGYESGTKLALVRYPHGGTFEIPILTVNNKNKDAASIIGNMSIDAVCINKHNAVRLSGADYDGDTVMCIPTHDPYGRVKITARDPNKIESLKGMIGFDTDLYGGEVKKDSNGKEHYYRNGHEYRVMKDTQKQMGVISNLITDMTLQGANDDELVRAVKHSMVVIDAEKHKLDYKQSEVDNRIAELKKKYQPNGGASTLISRAGGEYTVDKREGTAKVNLKYKKNGEENPDYDPSRPEGSLIWKTASDDKLYYTVSKVNKRTGEVTTKTEKRTQKSTQMAETDDAYTLISEADTPMERLYADYANKMKSMANSSRKEAMYTGKIEYDSNAKTVYQAEVDSLMSKLNTAELNRPRERQAQLKANAEVTAKKNAIRAKLKEEHPDATSQEINKMLRKEFDEKKAGQKALSKYRSDLGSVSRRDRNIEITDREWEAIQAGAISETRLTRILNNTDIDSLRERATPKTTKTLSATKIAMIKSMKASNYPIEVIAKKAGVSATTVSTYLKEGE